MEILDDDMQMVRDWLKEHNAPFHIASHFDNLADQHAQESARADKLHEENERLKDVESDLDDAKEEIKSLEEANDYMLQETQDVLTEVKYWLHDVLVLNGPMRTPPRVILRKIEEVLG